MSANRISHLPKIYMNGVDQIINDCLAVLFRDIGEMSVTDGCFGTGMAEKGLDVTKTQALLQQMCGKTVAQ